MSGEPGRGWGPPPAARPNPVANGLEEEPLEDSVFRAFFGVPRCVRGGRRWLYVALTLVAVPVLVLGWLIYFGRRRRSRRGRVEPSAVGAVLIVATGGVYLGFLMLGEVWGWNPHLLAAPCTLALAVAPLVGRVMLKRGGAGSG
ncbi:MAG: hypothetical protein VYE22_17940 [Myxococcota bacterium]|nr:hypothetical protein [Myxococcota bacterium]